MGRRKTTHVPPSAAGVHHPRRVAGELAKAGHKLTTEATHHVLGATSKPTSFVEEEKTGGSLGNAQSSSNLHGHLSVKPSSTTNGGQTTALLARASVTSAGISHQLILPKANYPQNGLAGYTSSRAGTTIASLVHSKMNGSSKTNLHSKPMQIIVEDKENRRDMVNRQSSSNPATIPQAPVLTQTQQTSSTTSLLKRSKTSDPLRAPLRQKEVATTVQ